MQHHKYSLSELEYMMPWEREIYLGLLEEFIKDGKVKTIKDLGIEADTFISGLGQWTYQTIQK